jgi:hypothetical protein
MQQDVAVDQQKRQQKFNAKKTILDDKVFDSKAGVIRYQETIFLKRGMEI